MSEALAQTEVLPEWPPEEQEASGKVLGSTSPANPEASPDYTERQVVEAVEYIREEGDTFDVRAKRSRGTMGLGSFTVAGLAPASGAAMLLGSNAGALAVEVNGITGLVTGAAASGAAYVWQRHREPQKAARVAAAEQVIRDSLKEPVDLLRHEPLLRASLGRPAATMAVRWYNDARYSGGDDAEQAERFKKVVDFAERHKASGIAEIIVAASLLDGLEEGNIPVGVVRTSTAAVFTRRKGVRIDDFESDEKLASMSVEDAAAIAKQLLGEVVKTDDIAVFARQLVKSQPQHPFTKLYQTWVKQGSPASGRTMLAATLERDVNEGFGGRYAPGYSKIGNDRVRMNTNARITPQGLQLMSSPARSLPGHESGAVRTERISFDELAGGSMEKLLRGLADRPQNKVLKAQELPKLHLALYYALSRKDDTIGRAGLSPVDRDKLTPTLYNRMADERPYTRPFRPGLRPRGTVSEEEQTMEYRRTRLTLSFRCMAVAGAIAIGELVAVPVAALHEASPPGPAAVLGQAADALYDGAVQWDETALTEAYRLHMLPPWLRGDMAGDAQKDLSARRNLYGDDSTSSVGDVDPTGANPTVWSLNPSHGAPTGGYWPEQVFSNITLKPDTSRGPMPPYDHLGMEMDNPSSFRFIMPLDTALSEEQQKRVRRVRYISLPETPPDPDRPLVEVSGRRLPDAQAYVRAGLDEQHSTEYQSYALPVRQGDGMVAVTVTQRELVTDDAVKKLSVRAYQQMDGTFHILVPKLPDGSYADITYWIGSAGPEDIPLGAERPMTVRQTGETPEPLKEVLTPADVAPILERRGLSPDATASEVAQAITKSDTYRYMPYKDAAQAHPPELDSSTYPPGGDFATPPTGEMLLRIDDYAEGMAYSNCNVAFMIGVLTSRGLEGREDVNEVVGFRNGNNDNGLAQLESHAYGVTSSHKTIDGTPAGGLDTVGLKADPYRKLTHGFGQEATTISEATLAALSMAGAVYGGRRVAPPIAVAVRRRRREHALHYFELDEGPQADDMKLLQYWMYGSSSAAYNKDASVGSMDAEQRARNLAHLNRQDIRNLAAEHVLPASQQRNVAGARYRREPGKHRPAPLRTKLRLQKLVRKARAVR